MITKLAIPVFASLLGFATLAAQAEEVKLSDNERTELRQRADDLKSAHALGGTRASSAPGAVKRAHDATPTKVKHGKKKHTRKAHGKRST